MGELALQLKEAKQTVEVKSSLRAIVSVTALFAILILGWAFSFPPIFYHLFVK